MAVTDVFDNPSALGPNLFFNNGQTNAFGEVYQNSAYHPPGGGNDFNWSFTEWNASSYINADDPTTPIVDPVLGTSVANWLSTDGAAGVAIFGTPGDYTYRLTASGGNDKDMFLQTVNQPSAEATFNHQITATIQEGLAAASASNGEAFVIDGFTVGFNSQSNPNYNPNLPSFGMFLQYMTTDSRGMPAGFENGLVYNVIPGPGNDNQALLFDANGQMQTVTIDLSSGVAQMAQYLYSETPVSQDAAAGSALLNMGLWNLGSMYVGPETNQDSSIALDVANPVVTIDNASTFDIADAKATSIAVTSGVNYNEFTSGEMAPVLVDIAASLTTADTSVSSPFNGATLTDPLTSDVTIKIALANTSEAAFKLPAASTSGATVSLSSDGSILTIAGDDADALAALQTISLTPDRELTGTNVTDDLTVSVTSPAGTTTSTLALEITGTEQASYTSIGTNEWRVGDDPSETAVINPGLAASTIFGGAAALDFTGAGAVLVFNQPGFDESGKATIVSGGNDIVWAGSGTINATATGHNLFVLDSTSGENSTVFLSGNDLKATTTLDNWGLAGQTVDVVNQSAGSATIWGAADTLDYTGGNTTIVFNDASVVENGEANIVSLGNNLIWTGSGKLDYQDGGHSWFVLDATAGQDANLAITGTQGSSTDLFENFGSSNQSANIVDMSLGSSTVFGGAAATAFTGGNATLVFNQPGETGAANVTSTGNDVVWGGSRLDFTEGSTGSDTVVAGAGATVVNGTTGHASGETTVTGDLYEGTLVVHGGSKAELVSVGEQEATVSAASGNQVVNMGGTGNLTFFGGAGSADLTLGSGLSAIYTGSGATTLMGGSGLAAVHLGSGIADLNFNGAVTGDISVYGFSAKTAFADLTNFVAGKDQSGDFVMTGANNHTITFVGLSSTAGIWAH